MNSLKYLVVIASMLLASISQATIINDVTGGGDFNGTVDTDNGWIAENSVSNGVNFWSLNANAGDILSIDIQSLIDFGISVYFGLVSDDIGFSFDNNGNFIDPITSNMGAYVGGTNGDFGEVGSQLADLLLTNTGMYTIAVGGDLGFGQQGDFDYSMNVNIISVPTPNSIALIIIGLLSLLIVKRKAI